MPALLLLLVSAAALLLAACAPAAGTAPVPTAGPAEFAVGPADPAAAERLLAPFRADLAALGVTIERVAAFRYEGSDPDAFVAAINAFYRRNPGHCPLREAFYVAPDALRFMTVASDDGTSVRAFLYDQSRRPRLLYAYLEGVAARRLPAIRCETAR